MLVGILSDSHGQHLVVRQAMALFDELGVTHVIHCGDVGGVGVFDELVGRPCTFVWGNMDAIDGSLFSYLKTVGLPAPEEIPTTLTLDGKTFAVFHGHERGFQAALAGLDVDYIIHGHTHVARDSRRGSTRIINPGALKHARPKTVATLDTTTDELTFHEIRTS
jgi:putative phosphoesterase